MTWQKELQSGFKTAHELLAFLDLPDTLSSTLSETLFQTKVPLSFAKRMQRQNPQDPLLLQVLAQTQENTMTDGYSPDPLQEKTYTPVPSLLHKYHGRVLVIASATCPIHCRYCFRRHFPYDDHTLNTDHVDRIMQYIRNDSSIYEVILSGGEPLLMSNRRIQDIIERARLIPHVHTIRFHTRMPIVLPSRIDTGLLEIFQRAGLRIVIVMHSNHAQELDQTVSDTCSALKDVGCALLNQSVLLRNINDDSDTLVRLSLRLWACGILPYYLHVLDKVQNTAHFDVTSQDALQIHKALCAKLPGYLVPRLVREEPGEKHKTLLF